MQDGYEVLIDEFDPEERAKQTEAQRVAEAQAHEARLAEQSRAVEVLQAEFAKTMGIGASGATAGSEGAAAVL